jgi:ABC-type methionine transport system ATPase subunit
MTIISKDVNFDLRKKEVRIKLRIPKKFQGYPIISRLTSQYNLQVNIVQAILGANGEGDGWFDLLIQGKQEEIDDALIYLTELDIEMIYQDNQELDGW